MSLNICNPLCVVNLSSLTQLLDRADAGKQNGKRPPSSSPSFPEGWYAVPSTEVISIWTTDLIRVMLIIDRHARE